MFRDPHTKQGPWVCRTVLFSILTATLKSTWSPHSEYEPPYPANIHGPRGHQTGLGSQGPLLHTRQSWSGLSAGGAAEGETEANGVFQSPLKTGPANTSCSPEAGPGLKFLKQTLLLPSPVTPARAAQGPQPLCTPSHSLHGLGWLTAGSSARQARGNLRKSGGAPDLCSKHQAPEARQQEAEKLSFLELKMASDTSSPAPLCRWWGAGTRVSVHPRGCAD